MSSGGQASPSWSSPGRVPLQLWPAWGRPSACESSCATDERGRVPPPFTIANGWSLSEGSQSAPPVVTPGVAVWTSTGIQPSTAMPS